MNLIAKLKSKPKMLIVAASLLFGLALTPATSIAAHSEYKEHKSARSHHKNNRDHHGEKIAKHHRKHRHGHGHGHDAHRHHIKHKHSHHNTRRNHYHEKPRYVVINNDHHHRSERAGLQIGVHTGNLDVVFRD